MGDSRGNTVHIEEGASIYVGARVDHRLRFSVQWQSEEVPALASCLILRGGRCRWSRAAKQIIRHWLDMLDAAPGAVKTVCSRSPVHNLGRSISGR